MKRFFNILLVTLLVLSLALTAALAEGDHRVAKDGAQIQTDDPTMPTRVPMEGGTKILLHFGDNNIQRPTPTRQPVGGCHPQGGTLTMGARPAHEGQRR